jgi:hypothetical protein
VYESSKKTAEQFAIQMAAFKRVGMFDAVILSFGSLLGHCRGGGIIPDDDDMDLIVITKYTTKKQELAYFDAVYGLLHRYRWDKAIRPDNGRPLWLSVRMAPVEQCMKCCHWFTFEYKGYNWHHKGPGSLIKGCPAEYLEPGEVVNFLGTEVRVPKQPGNALSFWYGDWATPRYGGSSSKKILMTVQDWSKENTWSIKIR